MCPSPRRHAGWTESWTLPCLREPLTCVPRLRHARSSPLLESPNLVCTTRCLCCRVPRLRHARSSPLLESPNLVCTTRCLCCRSARALICFLSTTEGRADGELEVDCRGFFFAATALVLQDRSSFRGGDRDDDRRLFLDTVTTAVFVERTSDGGSFLLAASASLDGCRFPTQVASMSSMASLSEQSVRTRSFALATKIFLLFVRECEPVSVPLS